MQVLICAALVMAPAFAAAADVTIVRDGQPAAVIVLQPDAPDQLAEAVTEMQALIQRSTGAALQLAEAAPAGLAEVHVGRTAYVQGLGLELGDLDGDGFVIRFPRPDTVVIVGPTDWGTEFGLYEFLERYVGVRWLMPGPDGTYVPARRSITVPAEPVRDEPAFFSRKYFGLHLEPQQTWARRNRLHSRIEFHHQLYLLFPPSDIQEHPEFFPIHRGTRYFPPQGQHYHGWQPCFTAPGIVDVAVQRITQFFDEHPEVESYSLGVTDSSGHCECDNCRALDPGRKNMIGRDHLTDRYLTWANAVVEGVLRKHPDKWFGFLAYSEIFEPPDRVKMHPRLIPYMTYDRHQWIEPQARAAAEELTRRWAAAATTVGWYDYIYGAPYLLPRVYMHTMAQYYRFAHSNGVRALTAEAYPNFGEGPKLYVSLKLQWNPYQDVDALLDEWYELAVGAEAAPYLKRYYEHWEDFWTRRILASSWWVRGRQYLPFNSPKYLDEVSPEEIAQSRQWLEAAVARAASADQRARAELLLRAFEYYEASALGYPRAGEVPQLATESDALEFLDRARRQAPMAQLRRQLALVEFRNHPFLHHGISIARYDALQGTDWGAADLWAVLGWLERSDAVRGRLAELAQAGLPEGIAAHVQAMLRVVQAGHQPLNTNPSFEEGADAQAAGYSYWLQDNVGSLMRSEQAAYSGNFGLIAEGVQYGGPHQSIEFAPGRYCLIVRLFVPEGQQEGGFVDLSLRALNEANQNLPKGANTSVIPTSGQWQVFATCMDVREPPAGAVRIRAGVWMRDYPPGKRVYLDDMQLIRLDD